MDEEPSLTQVLQQAKEGSTVARAALLERVYDELRALAAGHLAGERRDHTLQPTALVHEVYIRLLHNAELSGANRAQFFSVASKAMRRILINHARDRARQRRGGKRKKLPLSSADLAYPTRSVDLLTLDEALERLTELDTRKGKIVELRYFGGLTTEETAETVGVSIATVERDWKLARTWLRRELKKGDSSGD